MKNFKKLVVLICLTMVFSCSNSSDEDLGLTGEGSLTAKVNGADFASLNAAVAAVVTNGVLVVQGSNASGEFIRINISNYNGVGVYKTGDAISNTNSISYGTVNPIATWISTFNVGSGTIEITEETNTAVEGTFSFEGVSDGSPNKTVTAGKFNAPKE